MIETQIKISRIHYPVTTLGPGSRVGIWFQGCSIRCVGCVSADTWSHEKGRTTIQALMERIRVPLTSSDGITISGGEPFDQIEELKSLLIEIRKEFEGDILVYSGYSFEKIQGKLSEFENLIDVIIVDPFVIGSSQNYLLRGSDNQRMIFLSSLGENRFKQYDRPIRKEDKVMDVAFDDENGDVYLVGIPRPGDLGRLMDLLESSGHLAVSTEDRRGTK